ncbi:MAG: DUF4156 domain-containing protein [Wenzhouxiangellaceae bacterium]|nr:DUF4156 domain-containing protein [Wenzhouxiangellaceae bacterium]MBS3824413.1 DUF4156 domain-containing protein [Wenzhouxiangellaceae bacterium]
MLRFLTVAVLIPLTLAACAWVQLTEEGESVDVADADRMTDCRRIGEVTVSVRDRVAAVQRKPGKVAEELERLARNEAAELGGDHVVALGPVRDGGRRYAVFDCRDDRAG